MFARLPCLLSSFFFLSSHFLSTSSRSGGSSSSTGRDGGAWIALERERRSLEETISELNMRLAGKDHDIAELRMQIDERERDLRLMHGKVSTIGANE